MPRFKTQTVAMPAFWASAIINLDYSGLDPEDRAALNNHLVNSGLSFSDCLDVGETYTARFNGLLCEVADYTFKVQS